jgi:hypothetical protein
MNTDDFGKPICLRDCHGERAISWEEPQGASDGYSAMGLLRR